MGIFTFAAVIAGFLRAQVLDTDHYVDTVAPLAADPAIQTAVVDALTRSVMSRVDVERLASDLLDTVGDAENRGPRVTAALRSVPALLAAQSEGLVRNAVSALVHSDAFPELWNAANRQAHRGLVAAVTGIDEGALRVQAGVVSISLTPMVAELVDELDSRGFVLADRAIDLPTEFVLAESDDLAQAQRAVRLLDRAAIVLAAVAVGCALSAVLVAGNGFRRRAILAVAAGVLVSMVVLAVALLIARRVYLEHVPAQSISPEVARIVFDTLVGPLRMSMRVLAVSAAAVGLGAFLAGPSAPASWVRATAGRVGDRLRRGEGGPVSGFVAANLGWVRGAVLLVAAAVLLFWDYPTVRVAVLIAVVTGVVLLALELVARPRRAGEDVTGPG
ncbi:hypothetical protein ACWZHB_17350 [Nocardia sp. FBN12]|uniref:hypothetical protein n=1 Tax=Nocardia sp. FBN12 TaxID=3419766 RepID=UPI003CFE6D5F